MPKPPPLPSDSLKPYWQTTDAATAKLYHGHVLDVLPRLPAASVQMICTSPPYWGLRTYSGVEPWAWPAVTYRPTTDSGEVTVPAEVSCYGGEKTPAAYVGHSVLILRELRRVLRDDGVVWWNIADSCLKNGNTAGIPWRVGLAVQADGWMVRQDIIWSKPAPICEPVTDRCTRSHEYILLVAKRKGYYYDHWAIATDPSARSTGQRTTKGYTTAERYGADNGGNGGLDDLADRLNSGDHAATNRRSVWRMGGKGYEMAHYAVFPEELPTLCVKAGSSEYGCCAACGTPYARLVDKTKLRRDRPNEYVKRKPEVYPGNTCGNSVAGVLAKTLGWVAGCECVGAGVVPCTVLDPFVGSGTTAEVAVKLGRRAWGIDASVEYLRDHAFSRVCYGLRAVGKDKLIPGVKMPVFRPKGEGKV